MYNLVDTAYIGRLGTNPLAALTFSFPRFFRIISVNLGMGIGLNSLVSRQLGAGEKEAAANTVLHGLLAALGGAGLIFLVAEIFLDPIISLLGARGEVHQLCGDYMRIVAAGVFIMFPMNTLTSSFTAQGDTVTPMKIQFFTLFLNLALDPLFIFTFGLGIKGAALATNLGLLVGLITALIYIHKRSILLLRRRVWQFSPVILKELYAVGLPASLTMLLMAFYMMGINRLIAGYGTDTVAALGLITRIDSAVVIPIMAISVASLTLSAMFFGRGRFELLRQTVAFAIKICVIFAVTCSLLMFISPISFLRPFTNESEALRLAALYLRLEVLSFPFMAITICANRSLQGLGFSLPGLIINGTRLFMVALPLAALAVLWLQLDFHLVALAGLAGNLTAATMAYFWLRRILTHIELLPRPPHRP